MTWLLLEDAGKAAESDREQLQESGWEVSTLPLGSREPHRVMDQDWGQETSKGS